MKKKYKSSRRRWDGMSWRRSRTSHRLCIDWGCGWIHGVAWKQGSEERMDDEAEGKFKSGTRIKCAVLGVIVSARIDEKGPSFLSLSLSLSLSFISRYARLCLSSAPFRFGSFCWLCHSLVAATAAAAELLIERLVVVLVVGLWVLVSLSVLTNWSWHTCAAVLLCNEYSNCASCVRVCCVYSTRLLLLCCARKKTILHSFSSSSSSLEAIRFDWHGVKSPSVQFSSEKPNEHLRMYSGGRKLRCLSLTMRP